MSCIEEWTVENATTREVWVLGGTGRTARAVAAELRHRGLAPVLVGRDAARLAAAARASERTVTAGSVEEMAAEVRRHQPPVVINTIAPFSATASSILATPVHYIDVANDVGSVSAMLDRDEEVAASGKTAVTGAGFGMTGTESILIRLLDGRRGATAVRVDMVPSLEIEAGAVGESLAATILTGILSRDPRAGRLGAHPLQLGLPDGTQVRTASMPLGDLVAAERASGAASVIAATDQAPSGLARAILPLASVLLAAAPMRTFLRRRLARVTVKAQPRPREHSWAHARVEWADGTIDEGWLRVGDAWTFTGAVPAEIARRLLDGEGRPGAFTPAALFGPSLAEACGATYLSA
jgi:short subunit dehydrogenase-like uncharacterized protein